MSDIDPRNVSVPSGTRLTDVPTKVTLRTLCGCERTFEHGNRASLGMVFVVPLKPPPPTAIASEWPLTNEDPIRRREFKFHHFKNGDPNHWVYEEVHEVRR